jgi:hypothetical protein
MQSVSTPVYSDQSAIQTAGEGIEIFFLLHYLYLSYWYLSKGGMTSWQHENHLRGKVQLGGRRQKLVSAL